MSIDNSVACSSSSTSGDEGNRPAQFGTAERWFQQGQRVRYDPQRKKIVQNDSPTCVHVWERVVAPFDVCSQTRWLTLLPGPPEGTFGFSKVDTLLQTAPRLYVEYVGLGDSDKPSDYAHSVMDRANLVEAQWRAHKVRRTVLVCVSSSSMVMMELLHRQRERRSLGLPVRSRIEHVLCINGGYYADAHTPHPLNQCQIVKKTVGKVVVKTAQRSNIVLDPIIKGCFSSEYRLSKEELRQISKVVRRHKGTNYFSGSASHYVQDHEHHADRWDLSQVYHMSRGQGVSFTCIGGEEDRFENKSYALAKERLDGSPDIHFESLQGGYCLTLEHPHRVATLIDGMALAPAYEGELWGGCSKRASMETSSSDTSTLSTGNSTTITGTDDWANTEFPLDHEFPL